MRRGTGVFALLLVVLTATGCHRVSGSGTVVSRTIDVGEFSALQVSHAFTVNVTPGSGRELTVRVDDNLVDSLDIAVSDDTLRIALDPDIDVGDATLEAHLTAPSFGTIEASGSSTITFAEGFAAPSLDVTLSGASRLQGALDADAGAMHLSGASIVSLSGTVGTLVVTASGASRLGDLGLTVDELSIDLSGASTAELSVPGTLSASASGASTLRYAGSPSVERSETAEASSIEPVT